MYPQSASGYNMERHTNSSGYSREMMGQYNPSSAQASYQEMRSSTPVEQLIDSADSSNKKGSVDELDDLCKEGKVQEAVEVLDLLEQQHVTVDLSRYIMLMDVCGEDKSLEDAKSVHEHLVRSHPHLDIKMYNKILEMYGKCGSMNDAFLVFRKMPQRNLTSWDTMITWLGKNGLGEDAIDLFGEFKETGMKPDGQMFLGVFHVCSVVGDIVEGMLHFESMSKDYGIVLSMEQYVGVVDMLGRTGYLDEAMEFIERMPIEPSLEVWETMMNLCRIHGNLELGDRCAEIVELQDPSRLDEQSKVGFLAVKASGIAKEKEKKKSAQSLLEARSKVHEYRAGDRSHPDHEKIYALLRALAQPRVSGKAFIHSRWIIFPYSIRCERHSVQRLSITIFNATWPLDLVSAGKVSICITCPERIQSLKLTVSHSEVKRLIAHNSTAQGFSSFFFASETLPNSALFFLFPIRIKKILKLQTLLEFSDSGMRIY
ncbi:hypothetical protein K7X08_006528 [Anisodus acutangulus]|uniref:Pentatricopeptide repeat-containing protein n=1 Tax=Anisodus acutangulus TaxID=402998 RepID=A0A9Q1RRI6_9SOLA|nr:hypothetical protein K7X08_006528 [Anisodus acutangulus]